MWIVVGLLQRIDDDDMTYDTFIYYDEENAIKKYNKIERYVEREEKYRSCHIKKIKSNKFKIIYDRNYDTVNVGFL